MPIAIIRCGRCRHEIRTVTIKVEDGKLELEGLPSRCTDQICQAGFGDGAGYALEVTLYAPGRTD
jgi:hypothetical protein